MKDVNETHENDVENELKITVGVGKPVSAVASTLEVFYGFVNLLIYRRCIVHHN